MERRNLGGLIDGRRLVRLPDAALNVGQDVSQLGLGPLTIPPSAVVPRVTNRRLP